MSSSPPPAENTGDGSYGLVFNETESFWLTPWLAGFGASVFADDGTTPTLDTPEMQAALEFLYDLKYTEQVMPTEADYTIASDLFTTGSAAMIVNGDWELGNYARPARRRPRRRHRSRRSRRPGRIRRRTPPARSTWFRAADRGRRARPSSSTS